MGHAGTELPSDSARGIDSRTIDPTTRVARDLRDRALIDRVRESDQDAYSALHRMYVVALRRLAVGYTHDEMDAEDVVQDVFVELWRIRDRLVLRGTVASYLCGAVRNRSVDFLRRRRTEQRRRSGGTLRAWFGRIGPVARVAQSDISQPVPQVGAGVSFNSGETRLLDHDLKAAADAAIAAMPPRCREVFLMARSAREDHTLSYAEIGEALGIAPATVRLQLIKALDILEARLAAAGWSNVLRRHDRGRVSNETGDV